MKFILLASLLVSSVAFAETTEVQASNVQVGHQCRAGATDGAYGIAVHMSIYTAQEMALQSCKASSRRPETCQPVGCFQVHL